MSQIFQTKEKDWDEFFVFRLVYVLIFYKDLIWYLTMKRCTDFFGVTKDKEWIPALKKISRLPPHGAIAQTTFQIQINVQVLTACRFYFGLLSWLSNFLYFRFGVTWDEKPVSISQHNLHATVRCNRQDSGLKDLSHCMTVNFSRFDICFFWWKIYFTFRFIATWLSFADL